MRSIIKKYQMMLFSIIFIGSLISCATALVPKLELRTLRLSKDFPGFEYRYCVKKKLFRSKCKTWKIDKYDLTDVKVRERLINMGFIAKVRQLP